MTNNLKKTDDWKAKHLNRITQVDCREGLRGLPDGCIDMCITSPPYWSLRCYKADPMVWDGDSDCEHEWGERQEYHSEREATIMGKSRTTDRFYGDNSSRRFSGKHHKHFSGQFCLKCGAWLGQLGLEPTPELYIQHLCSIFNEVWRVLKPTGSLWVNISDCYGGTGDEGEWRDPKYPLGRNAQSKALNKYQVAKSLVGIPEMFVLEMQRRGWIRRNTIIWHKPNCLPESVKDRFTVDFEYLYFFVKQQKYYFEQQFEPFSQTAHPNSAQGFYQFSPGPKKLLCIDSRVDLVRSNVDTHPNPQGRNHRSVWCIPTQPSSFQHYAIFPEALVTVPIRAGCPEFVCKRCGKPRVKITQPMIDFGREGSATKYDESMTAGRLSQRRQAYRKLGLEAPGAPEVIGLSDCQCNAGWEPGVCLDPFIGVGTTAKVAIRLNRDFIGFDISGEYVEMANKEIGEIQKELSL